ncbi:MAG: hypothetical protein RSA29_02215 [Clostridium sp.]|uniref:hypothetical protein n=1 Tax=Clostridium sp. TaxID=1506 RepID=UPI00305457A5
MAVNIINLSLGQPTSNDNAGTAEITVIPVSLASAFDNDLDNVLVTKVFKKFNSVTGAFDAIVVGNYAFTAVVGSAKTNGLFSYVAGTKLTENDIIQIRLYETDTTVPTDSNDTNFVVEDLYTTFDASGDVGANVPFQVPATAGNYNFKLTQTNETAPDGTIITAATTTVNYPVKTATIIINDYVDKIVNEVVKIKIDNAEDNQSTPAVFAGDYRTAFTTILVP